MPNIRTKSVYSPIDHAKDGLRILATRYRGRGLRNTRYHVWMANLAPSEQLLKEYGEVTWAEFKRRYRKELLEDGPIEERNPLIKNRGQKFTLRLLQQLAKNQRLTIMCHCDEEQLQCHRHILQEVLSKKV